jgi:hypothetical protein
MNSPRSGARCAVTIALLFLTSACGGGGGGGGPPPASISLTISPPAAALASGAIQQFTASVTGAANTAVQWSVQEGAAGGIIGAAGIYTAPRSAGTWHVLATSAQDSSKSAAATVTVGAPAISVAVSPATASLTAGGTQQFTASVTGAGNTAVTWSVQEAGGGSVSGAGLYSAPAPAGTYHVVAVSQADPSQRAQAAITVVAAAGVGVTVSPISVTLQASATQQFSATVTGTNNHSVVWTVQEGNAGGFVNTAGSYTAPSFAGTFHVVATSSADSRQRATATVTVTAPAPAVCDPPCLAGESCAKLSSLSNPTCNGDQCQHVTCPESLSCSGSLGNYSVSGACTAFDPGRAVAYGADCADGITGHDPTDETCTVNGTNTMHCDFPEGSIDCPAVWIYRGSPASAYTAGCCAVLYCGIPDTIGGSQRGCSQLSPGNGWSPAP